MKINLDDDGVFQHDMTVDECRNFGDEQDSIDRMVEALDNAQAYVFTDEEKTAYLVIKITK